MKTPEDMIRERVAREARQVTALRNEREEELRRKAKAEAQLKQELLEAMYAEAKRTLDRLSATAWSSGYLAYVKVKRRRHVWLFQTRRTLLEFAVADVGSNGLVLASNGTFWRDKQRIGRYTCFVTAGLNGLGIEQLRYSLNWLQLLGDQ